MNLLPLLHQADQVHDICLCDRQPRPSGKLKPLTGRSHTWAESFQLSDHAHLRVKQRGLNLHEVRYVLRYGTCVHAANAVIYYLRQIDIPIEHLRRAGRLEGTAVITANDDSKQVITIWRNRLHGTRNLHHKLNQL